MNLGIDWLEDEDDGEGEDKNKASFPVNREGHCLHIRADGPYGFFKVFTDKGPVPGKLKASWTDLAMAKAAVQQYIAQSVSSAKFNPRGEPAKIKKVKVNPGG